MAKHLAFILSVHPYRLAFSTDEPLARQHLRTAARLDEHEAGAAIEHAVVSDNQTQRFSAVVTG
ncbi:MAG: hypothetical protein M3N13_09705 [Candidatus Eremiobacteraeota bacterium]|nr:hypothetical protein [Candidatus Eremiobacteraeota bacterium]